MPALTQRELKRLSKMDGKLARGRLHFGLFGAALGFAGGLAWVGLMLLMAPGFGRNLHLSPPTGHEAHPLLEQIFYSLAVQLGPMPAICLLAGGMFAGAFGFFTWGMVWRLLVQNHAPLAQRAIANGQFAPRFVSPLLRRGSARV